MIVDLGPAEYLCEQLEELHNSAKSPDEKKQDYRDRYEGTAKLWFSQLQKYATPQSDPSILLTQDPGRIAKLFRDLISHQPKEDA